MGVVVLASVVSFLKESGVFVFLNCPSGMLNYRPDSQGCWIPSSVDAETWHVKLDDVFHLTNT